MIFSLKPDKTHVRPLLMMAMLTLAGCSLFAQGINEQVTVVGAFDPSIPDANKINISPAPDETEVRLPVMTYSVNPVQLFTPLSPDLITPVRLIGEPQKKLYRNYVKAGLGNYSMPYAEFFANSLRSKSFAFGVHLKHLSSTGKIKDYPKSNNSLNLIDASAQKFTGNHTLSFEAGFRRNVNYHYGFKPAEINASYSDDDLRQRFNRFHLDAAIRSNYDDKDQINHDASLKFSSISDLFKTSESLLQIHASADKRFELFDFTDNQTLMLETNLGFTGYKDSTLSQKSALISIKPSIGTQFEEYTVLFGLNFTFQADSASKLFLFPFAEARVNALDEALVLTAGITGGLERKGFDQLSRVNPFVQSCLPLKYTRDKFTFYAGARARAGKHINLSASFSSSSVENESFFINDPALPALNRFTLYYQDGNVMKGSAEAEYHSAEHIMIRAFANFEKWTLQNKGRAWHRPAAIFGAEAMYNLQKKIVVRAGIKSYGKQYARIPDPDDALIFTEKALKAYTDVNLGFEYRYTKLLSAFLNFSNLLGTRYYEWYNYPSYRLQVMGGITYSF